MGNGLAVILNITSGTVVTEYVPCKNENPDRSSSSNHGGEAQHTINTEALWHVIETLLGK